MRDMEKIEKFLITISLLFSIIIFSVGCTTHASVDTDHDGYTDDVDDYPLDPNFHQNVSIWSPGVLNLQEGQGADAHFNVESDLKVVVVNWSVLHPSNLSENEQHNITLEITIPPETEMNASNYYYDEVGDRNLRFTLNDSNWGNWVFSFYNPIDSMMENLTIYKEIYGMK
jgi:hypothetical protein